MRDLSDLDKESFERLVNDLLYAELAGKGVFLPNPTAFGVKDGGIDAAFEGLFRDTRGSWIVSVKGCGSAATLKKDLGDDFKLHPDRAWLVVTSLEPSTAKKGGRPSDADELTTWLSRQPRILQPSHLVNGLDVKGWLRKFPFIARSYGLVDGGGDLYFRAAGDVLAAYGARVPPPTRPRDLLDRVARAVTSDQSCLVVVQGPLGLGQPDLAAALVRDAFLGRSPWAESRRPIAVLVDETWLASPQELNRALRAELDLASGPYLFVVPPGPRAGVLTRGLWARVQDRSHRVLAFLTAAQVQDQGFAHAPPRVQVFEILPLREAADDEQVIRCAARAAPDSRVAEWTEEQLAPLIWDASGRIELAVDLATDRLIDRGMWVQDHLGPLLSGLDLSLEAARDALCLVALLAPVGVGEAEADALALSEIAGLVGCPVVALERLCGRLELWGLVQRRAWSMGFVWDLDAPLLSRAVHMALWRGPRQARLTERLLRHEGAVRAARALMTWDDDFARRLVEGLARPVLWGDLAEVGRELARLARLTELSPRVADTVVQLVVVGAERVSRASRAEESGEVSGEPQEVLRTLADLLVIAAEQGADPRRAVSALFDLLRLDGGAGGSLLAWIETRWAQPPGRAVLATQTLTSLRARVTEVPIPQWLVPLAVAVATPWLKNARPVGYATPLVGTMGASGWDERDEDLQGARVAAVGLLIAMTWHPEPEVWRAGWIALGELWSWTAFAASDLPMPPPVQALVVEVLRHAERELSAELDWERRATIERVVRHRVLRTGAHEGATARALRCFSSDPAYLAWRWLLRDEDVVRDAGRLATRLDNGEGEAAVREHLPLSLEERRSYEGWLAGQLAEQRLDLDDALHLLDRVAASAPSDLPRLGSGLVAAWMGQDPALWRALLGGELWGRIPRALRGTLVRSALDAVIFGHPIPFSGDNLAQVSSAALDALEQLRRCPTDATLDDLRDLFVPLWPMLAPDGRSALFLALSEHPDPDAREIVAAEVEAWQCGYFPRPTREDVARVTARLTRGPAGATAVRVILEKVSYYVDDPDNRVATAVGVALLEHPDALRSTSSYVNHPEHPHAEARAMAAVMGAEPDLWIQHVRQIPEDRAAWFVAPVESTLAGHLLRQWSVGYPVEARDRATLHRLVDRVDPDDTARLVVDLVSAGRSKVAAEVLVLLAPSATAPYADAVGTVLGALGAADRGLTAAGIRSRICGAWSGEVPVARWRAVAGCLDARGQQATGDVQVVLQRLAQDIERMCTLHAPRGG